MAIFSRKIRFIGHSILIYCTFACYCFCAEDESTYKYAEDNLEESYGKIVYSSVIFRHGDRTIKDRYPTDPYPMSIWGARLELTKRGKQQVYNLGKWYSKRYRKILGPGYDASLVLMNSTNTDRALMSGELFLAGMFPPTVDELWADDGLEWQPIPVHTDRKELNNIIGDPPCSRYDKERKFWSMSEEAQLFYQQYADTIEYVCRKANYTTCTKEDAFSTFQNVWTVYNCLFIEESNGYALPSWTKKIYPEPSRTISAFYFLSKTYSLEMRRLKGGPLLGNIIDEMEAKRAGTQKRIIHFYSGQETTIAIFLHTLDLYDFIIPSYTASIMVELRKKNDQFYVTILYRNDTSQPPLLLQLPGCDKLCTLEEFKGVTEYLTVKNWKSECRIGFFEGMLASPALYIDFIVLVCIIGVIIIVVVFIKRKKSAIIYEHIQTVK